MVDRYVRDPKLLPSLKKTVNDVRSVRGGVATAASGS
jgi:hypothetical protein